MKNFTNYSQQLRAGKRLLVLLPVLLAAGQSVQAQQYYGVYTERAGLTNKLVYGPTVNLYRWNNLADITPAPAPFEGQEILAVRAGNGADWFGMGVDNPPLDMSGYAAGALKFQYKTTYAGQVKVGIKSGSSESWIDFPVGSVQYGMVRDGSWHQVSIPLSAFQQQLPALNLSALTSLFMFAGEPAGGANDFLFDDIFFTSSAVVTATINRGLAATCTLAPNPSQGRAQLAFTPAQTTPYAAALYDLKGALIATIGAGTATGKQLTSLPVATDGLATGVYLVKLTTGQTVLTKRLVVNR
ncbi:T9SS type A sorting domain-containing protein [Hymenobacter sp. IS2118]|uniref:T9SS type A sorting domain-containing protein n=1 Tax=Hymenobacter sp. IS2118 TaxID=1505605 RepID=UPI00055116D1|nr:T9SS type A sorting domain-containing protein [Hymenobacter sp. IS2118]